MASKPEQRMWKYLSDKMTGFWHACRHEEELSSSTPDVSFARHGVDGWIELKTIKSMPMKPDTPVRVRHLRPGQVNWMEDRGKHGSGAVWTLLAVGEDMDDAVWFLVPHNRVRELYDGKMTSADLRLLPRAHSSGIRELMLDAIARTPR